MTAPAPPAPPRPSRNAGDRIAAAIVLRLAAVAVFALMNAGIKLAEAGSATLGEIMFWRQAPAAVLVVAVAALGPGLASLKTGRFGAQVLRAGMGLTAMALTFTALLLLPLAEATTIGFSMPIFATILGALVLGEPTGWRRWAAVLTGFAGVLIVMQPGAGQFPLWGAMCGLAAAFMTASVSILLRTLGRSERPLTTVFWFSTLTLAPLGVWYGFAARAHDPATWAVLVGIGLLGGLGQLAMTSSLSLGPVSVVVPMDYAMLLWATLLGWLMFDRLPAAATWIGAPVIIASGLYIIWREHVRRRTETVQLVAEP